MAEVSASLGMHRAHSGSSSGSTPPTGSPLVSPKARRMITKPRWRDPRLAVGVALMALSVVAATVVVSGVDHRVAVWGAARDLAAGTKLTADDLRSVSVVVDDVDRYVSGDEAGLLGRTLGRDVGGGELLAVSAIGSTQGPTRLVTLPVEPLHSPPELTHGDRVDVYLSPRENSDAASSRLVLSNAVVSQAAANDRATGELAVVLDVESTMAGAVVAAGRAGVIDLVRVPVGAR